MVTLALGMTSLASPPRQICGVDFSGATDAGSKIWLALAEVDGPNLTFQECDSARSLLGSGLGLEPTLAVLCSFVASSGDYAFGFDFPFGIPRPVMRADSWAAFLSSFSSYYDSADQFMQGCFERAGGVKIRRLTDQETKTPLSPYDLRLYKQTFYGIRDVLGPLVSANKATVLPMQRPKRGKAWILEICPASTLQRWRLRRPYKGRSDDRRKSRVHILRAIERLTPLKLTPAIKSRVLDDMGGDALDSIIAAVAVFEALPNIARRGRDKPEYAIEGYVYA